MNELIIPIDWSVFLPFVGSLFICVICFLVGFGADMHFSMMSGGLPTNTPNTVCFLISGIRFASWGLMLGAVTISTELLFLSGVLFSSFAILFLLWIWSKGFHMNSFIEQMMAK